ncbi:agamous MADS-box protein AGL80 [Trifolium repens]|nr:agamous MADS-box protein AGL80 [Trifolium repens]
MARHKVKLAYIECILKKLKEITTLCGIKACAVIYGNNNPQPEVWPSDSGAKSVLSRFVNLPNPEKSKKTMDQEAFLGKSIEKAYEQLKKEREETRKIVMTIIMDHYINTKEFNGNSMSKYDLNDMSCFVDENLKKIYQKMEGMQIESQEHDADEAEVMNGTNKQ